MNVARWWLRRNVTQIGALAATSVLAGLVTNGAIPFDRAVGPAIFAWMFALHAYANRTNVEQHQRATLAALQQTTRNQADAR